MMCAQHGNQDDDKISKMAFVNFFPNLNSSKISTKILHHRGLASTLIAIIIFPHRFINKKSGRKH